MANPGPEKCALLRQKPFPMQQGPSIPWELAEDIYRAYAACFGSGQSLERMAERGGFGWCEVVAINREYLRKFGRMPEGWSRP